MLHDDSCTVSGTKACTGLHVDVGIGDHLPSVQLGLCFVNVVVASQHLSDSLSVDINSSAAAASGNLMYLAVFLQQIRRR